jgi:hypothetical protein
MIYNSKYDALADNGDERKDFGGYVNYFVSPKQLCTLDLAETPFHTRNPKQAIK